MFIGDSGSYVLGFIYGYLLIEIYVNSQNLSPFYIILLVWYPCFETLFSIIRKFRLNRSPILPDTKHLHQLLYISIKKKFKLPNVKTNIYSAIVINIYNLFIVYLASTNVSNSQFQIFLIFISILVYCYLYFSLFKNLFYRKL